MYEFHVFVHQSNFHTSCVFIFQSLLAKGVTNQAASASSASSTNSPPISFSPNSPASASASSSSNQPVSSFDQAVLSQLQQPLTEDLRNQLTGVRDLNSLSRHLGFPLEQARVDFLAKLEGEFVDFEFFQACESIEDIYKCLADLGIKRALAAKAARLIFHCLQQ